MKTTSILKRAIRNLARSKVRTILTVLSIFIGAFAISLTVALNSGVNTYMDEQLSAIGTTNQMQITKTPKETKESHGQAEYSPETGKTGNSGIAIGIRGSGNALTDEDIDKIKKNHFFEKVEGFLLTKINYIEGSNQKKFLFSATILADENYKKIKTKTGVMPNNNSSNYEVSINEDMRKAYGFKSNAAAVGQTVKLNVPTFLSEEKIVEAKISGIMEESLLSQGNAMMNKSLYDEVVKINIEGRPADQKTQYMQIIGMTKKGLTTEETDKLKQELKEEGYDGQTFEEVLGTVSTVINAVTGGIILFGAIALIAASFGIINTLYMSVQERTKEIGLMKALGLTQAKVFQIFSFEAMLIGFFGSFIGEVLAMGVAQIVNKVAADSFLKNMPGFVLLRFDLLPMLFVILLIMLIAFLAGVLPARKAAKLDPIEALRSE